VDDFGGKVSITKYLGLVITSRYDAEKLIITGVNINLGIGIGTPITVSRLAEDQSLTLGSYLKMYRDLGRPQSSWPIDKSLNDLDHSEETIR